MSKSTGNYLTLSDALQKFSADGMRFSLADAGDSIEDANFVEKMADAGLLRLYAFLDWVKEVLSTKDTFRSGPASEYTFNDKVFISEMNKAIQSTKEYYQGYLFKEALRSGFFEFQALRDTYREIEIKGMHIDLVLRFIRDQILILSPICPHTCEHIWSLLGEKESILRASWPAGGPVDEMLVQSSLYLQEATHSFRLRLKSAMAPGKGKKVAINPSHGTIWVAKTYPPWQKTVLTTLKQMYEEKNEMPDNKIIAGALQPKPELKKYSKKIMPFVQIIKESFSKDGMKALNLTTEYNEMDILQVNLKYLISTLELEGIEIKFSDLAEDKVKEECCPGKPFMTFTEQASVKVRFVNPQPYSGLFELLVPIYEGDETCKIANRIAKLERSKIKDAANVRLLRYENTESGHRMIPDIDNPEQGKLQINDTAIFHIDTDNQTVTIQENGKQISTGYQLVYIVS
ncbi:leucine--tRNA ligase, cytoplasmic [Patella vulgata]|uniref:leucine--tRNA ligase, cytoplasmic n=1 Tax=Patella vulgata TaxID=6465 RepID=UPI0024A7D46B|nr:leucine--tRNA ligase, cytoplasmic [Patella vulgata]